MKNAVCRLRNQVRALLSETGGQQIPSVTPYRFTAEHIPLPQPEHPYLYIVLDGVLRLHTPSGMMDYMAGQYSVSKIDTPLSGTVLAFSDQRDFLAVSVAFQPSQAIQTILSLDNDLTERIMAERMEEREMSASDRAVLESAGKLLDTMTRAVPSDFIRRHITTEILYDVLCGSCGKQLIQSIANIRQADEIYRANSWIKENFRNSFAVEDLAEQRNMSVSLFHQKFKSAVGMGPLQCQKWLRLTEARRLMLDERKNVTEASAEVGYESLSQFIRDYRKMFGAAPREDLLNLRKQLEKQADFLEKQASAAENPSAILESL